MNKIRWKKIGKYGQPYVEVNEGNGWVHFTKSKNYVADEQFSSELYPDYNNDTGFATWQRCVKPDVFGLSFKAYIIEPTEIL